MEKAVVAQKKRIWEQNFPRQVHLVNLLLEHKVLPLIIDMGTLVAIDLTQGINESLPPIPHAAKEILLRINTMEYLTSPAGVTAFWDALNNAARFNRGIWIVVESHPTDM